MINTNKYTINNKNSFPTCMQKAQDIYTHIIANRRIQREFLSFVNLYGINMYITMTNSPIALSSLKTQRKSVIRIPIIIFFTIFFNFPKDLGKKSETAIIPHKIF